MTGRRWRDAGLVLMPTEGWYPDPAAGGSLRWWDGGRWTDRVRPRPTTVPSAPASRGSAGSPSSVVAGPRGFLSRRGLSALLVVALLGGAIAVAANLTH